MIQPRLSASGTMFLSKKVNAPTSLECKCDTNPIEKDFVQFCRYGILVAAAAAAISAAIQRQRKRSVASLIIESDDGEDGDYGDDDNDDDYNDGDDDDNDDDDDNNWLKPASVKKLLLKWKI